MGGPQEGSEKQIPPKPLKQKEKPITMVPQPKEKPAQPIPKTVNLNAAFMQDAMNGNTKACELLIKNGADVNSKDKNGRTVLMYACRYKHPETAKLLIEKGAKIEAEDMSGKTALMWASYAGSIETMKMLIDKGADVNPMVSKMIDLGDKEVKTYNSVMRSRKENKYTIELSNLLYIYAYHGDPSRGFFKEYVDISKEVKKLLEKGARANVKDANGYPMISLAANCGLDDVCRMLVEKGARVDEKDSHGDTPLYHAAFSGELKTCKFLLEKKADINNLNRRNLDFGGRTVLRHLMENKGDPELIKLLKKAGAKE